MATTDTHVPTPRRRRGRLALRILVPLLILAALAALAVLAVRLFSTPSYQVPDLVGFEQAAALAAVDEFEWDVSVQFARSDDEPRPDHVIRTVPAAEERLGEGEPFLVVVSEGPEFRTLPELQGLSFVDAEAQLSALDLEVVIEEAFDEQVPRGGVVRWSVRDQPELVAGGLVLPGAVVDVVSSTGPAPRLVPGLVGLSLADATAQLAALRLGIEQIEPVFDDVVPPGAVAAQALEPGVEVARDTVVQVALSQGPDLVILPDLAGTTFAEAQALLAAEDLVARLEFGASDGTFVSAAIGGVAVAAGEPVRRGSQVDVVFL